MRALNTGLTIAVLGILFFAIAANAGLERTSIQSYEDGRELSRRLIYSFLTIRGQNQEGQGLTTDTITYLLSLPNKPQIHPDDPVLISSDWLYVSDEMDRVILLNGGNPGWTVYDIRTVIDSINKGSR